MPETARKRGRERTYDAEKTRETILDAAQALFAEHGYDGASMDAIARSSGYNKSLLFQYFGDKAGLYAQVLKRADREMAVLTGRVFAPWLADEALAGDAARFREFLRGACAAFFDYMVAHPQVMRLFNWEQAGGWQAFSQVASQFEPQDLARFETLFSQARAAGLLRPGLDTVAAVVLIQQVCWSTPALLPLYQPLLAGRAPDSGAALKLVRAQVVDFLVAGILA